MIHVLKMISKNKFTEFSIFIFYFHFHGLWNCSQNHVSDILYDNEYGLRKLQVFPWPGQDANIFLYVANIHISEVSILYRRASMTNNHLAVLSEAWLSWSCD